MKLSEYIAQLQDIKDQFDDFEVVHRSVDERDHSITHETVAPAPFTYRLYTGKVVVVV